MRKKTILWADDDADDLMLMRQVLQEINNGFDITEVGNGRIALDFLENAKTSGVLPCLIILDMNMPVMNGRETLVTIKSDNELKDIPVVVFTTSNSELDKMFCKRYNVEMITKPPNYLNLKEAVEKLLGFCH